MIHKNIQYFIATIASAAIISITACKKDSDSSDHNHHHHTGTATITINSPLENAEFDLGETVPITGVIEGTAELHGWDLKLINTTTGTTVYDFHLHEHATSYAIDTSWVNNVTVMSDMELRVTVALDHDGTTTQKVVHFHCHNM